MGTILAIAILFVFFYVGYKERKNLPTEENPGPTPETIEPTQSKLIDCPECNLSISRKAETCPHCGFKLPKKSGCLFYSLLLVGFFIVFSILGHVPGNEGSSDEREAHTACEDYIKPRLKNPSSADFDTANAKVLKPKPDYMTFFLTVRATNSFNAVVPTNYACFVKKENGSWVVDSIQETN